VSVPRSAELWDTLVCPRCHTELQLISDDPPELDYADFDEDLEDYDEDYDLYDDDDEDEDDDDDYDDDY
jgi:hypothetical protein